MVGHLAENGLVVGDEFRHGNEAPASRNLEFIKYCRKQLPKGKTITALRADSASYQAEIFNYCNARKNRIEFAIGVPQDEAVVRQIKSLGASAWRPYGDGHIAETVHCMNRTEDAFRLIVVRRPNQKSLFDEQPVAAKYRIIATNRTKKAEQVLHWYNQRGEHDNSAENTHRPRQVRAHVVLEFDHPQETKTDGRQGDAREYQTGEIHDCLFPV